MAEYHARFLILEIEYTGILPNRETEGRHICLWVEIESAHLSLHVLVCDSSGGRC